MTNPHLDTLVSATPSPIDGVTTTLNYTQACGYNTIGNFVSKAGVTQYYSATQPHAVRSLSDGSSFQYDSNGNMTQRVELSGTQLITYTQDWDVSNRLVVITNTVSGQVTQYFYDADGQRVKRVTPQGTTWYVSADYEVTGPAPVVTVTVPTTYTHKLYFPIIANSTPPVNLAPARVTYRFNGQQVAVREGVTLTFVHGDHLGSASLTTDISGTKVSELRYTPYGETRYSIGDTPTNKRFTSQQQEVSIGLYDYGARFYDAQIGRFISADAVVPQPGDPQAYNRYAYVLNSPLNHTDRSGHCLDDVCNNSVVSHVTYNAGYVTLLQSVIREHSLNSNIVSPHFVAQVLAVARQSKLPPQLLAASMYAEMHSRWVKDEFEDAAVTAVGQCRTGCEFGDPMWSLAKVGELFIANDQSFGPAKIKPSAILNSAITVPTLRQAGISVPSDATDAAVQSLDFDHSVQFAAAYLKGLADLRKGDSYRNSREFDMTKVDMQVVRVAYNEGLATFRQLSGGTFDFYQTATNIKPGGVGDEVSPWLDAFAELYGD
ncbi:MAG: RHS repeat-associated core domain-containing protein [Chloroflexi bacterium]|nr:RHS repeat-associated core domain-containing protein [Chloroflexota bacterium]